MVSFLDDEGPVRVTDLASRMGVSKPSALAALRSLESQGLLLHEKYRLITLTDDGRRRAAQIRERHAMLAAFLRDVLGVSPKAAEDDACKMEHCLSSETLDRMRAMVASPRPDGPPPDSAPERACEIA